jgi:tRNA splicing endonuclease
VGRREIEKLHVRLNETEMALDRARSTSKSRGRSLKLLKTDFESSLEEISRLQERSQSLEEFLVTARAEQEVLRSRLEELKTTLSESKTERKELDVLTAEQKQEIARIHKELDTSHDTHRKAVEKIEELSSRLEEVEAALDRPGARVESGLGRGGHGRLLRRGGGPVAIQSNDGGVSNQSTRAIARGPPRIPQKISTKLREHFAPTRQKNRSIGDSFPHPLGRRTEPPETALW